MIRDYTVALLLKCAAILLALPVSISLADEPDERFVKWGKSYEDDILPIIRSRCLECHTGEKADGEFDLAKYTDGNSAVAAGDVWDRVARRVRQNEMPPQGSPGLNDGQKSRFHRWVDTRPGEDLCKQLASDETQAWYKGNVMSRRLTASEYANAVKHLVGVQLLATEVPPSDGAGGEGFDTVGDALFTSPIHLEAYLSVADRVIESAIASEMRNGSPNSPKLFTAVPKSIDSASSLDDLQAAKQVIRTFAKRAWRRPVNDDEVERLIQLYESVAVGGAPFTVAIAQPLQTGPARFMDGLARACFPLMERPSYAPFSLLPGRAVCRGRVSPVIGGKARHAALCVLEGHHHQSFHPAGCRALRPGPPHLLCGEGELEPGRAGHHRQARRRL